MKVAFTGDRNWTDEETVKNVITDLPEDTQFILGCAKGLDTIARNICEDLGRDYIVEYAEWNKYGKAAGHIRNTKMLSHLDIGDKVYAFHPNIALSKGTKNCAKQANEKGLNVIIVEGKTNV
jgi:hypothetical protein